MLPRCQDCHISVRWPYCSYNRLGAVTIIVKIRPVTLEEKSLRCIYKAGTSPLEQVITYASHPTKKGWSG
ncbi:MAG: UxaA family hydrolase [Desulfobacterales bacterium]|nr:UxaA family hydrolase [Desulfobacterales bacterium]